jgi:glucokinase
MTSSAGSPAGSVFAGIDVGGTTTQVVLVDAALRPLAHATTRTPALEGGAAIVGAASALVDGLLGDLPGARLSGIGMGTAGVVDSASGTISVVSDSFAGWAGFDIRGTLEARHGAPTTVANDVNAFLAGEMTAGAGRGTRNALGITLGTGVGGALWLDGRLFVGAHGAAGEIGHTPGFGGLPCTCGESGHLETLAAGRSISRLYRGATGADRTPAEVSELAHDGDADARRIFREAGEGVARAILIATALLDIETVVVGGGVSNAWPLLYPAIADRLEAEPPVRGSAPAIIRGELGDSAVAQGAAALGAAAAVAPAVVAPSAV